MRWFLVWRCFGVFNGIESYDASAKKCFALWDVQSQDRGLCGSESLHKLRTALEVDKKSRTN
jgi:hypothetical protein